MKVLHIIQRRQLRGAEIFACQLSNHLVKDGHEIRIVSLMEGDALLPFSGEVKSLGRPVSKRFLDWKGLKMLRDEIENFQPDVVQANAGDTLKFSVLSRLFFTWKAPIVFRNASTVSLYVKSPYVRQFNSLLLRMVARVISVSEHSMEDFVQVYPHVKDKIEVIPIGINFVEVASKPVTTPYLLHVGGFTFEKNHEGLIRIAKQVLLKHSDLELWLVGDGSLRSRIEALVNESGLRDRIRFLGFREDVLSIMKSAKALLLPSIIEGMPGVILEAQYCETPVVAYDVGGIREVVKSGATGWLIEKGAEAQFAQAIDEAIGSTESGSKIIAQAKTQVLGKFGNSEIARRFIAAYQKVVKPPVVDKFAQ